MTRIGAPTDSFNALTAQIGDSLKSLFDELVDTDPKLTPDIRDEVKSYFTAVNDFMVRHNMRLAQRSLKQLIILRSAEGAQTVRRDGTSCFVHEFSQALYLIWLHENRSRVLKSPKIKIHATRSQTTLFNTLNQIENGLAVIFNHDSREDHELEASEFQQFMELGMPADKLVRRRIGRIVYAFDRINKLDSADEETYARRFGQTEISLGCKMIDTTHNFMSLIGSGRNTTKIRKYIGEKMQGYELNQQMIARKDMLVYLHDYLKAQAELILLYCDVKDGLPKVPQMREVIIRNIMRYTEKNYTSSLDDRIHPILGITRRIQADTDVQATYFSTRYAPEQDPAGARSRPPVSGLLPPTHAPGM